MSDEIGNFPRFHRDFWQGRAVRNQKTTSTELVARTLVVWDRVAPATSLMRVCGGQLYHITLLPELS